LLYAIHGVLHLAGYDDRTRRGFVRMHQREDRILKRIGVGPVFNPAPRRATGRRRSRRPSPPPRRSEGTGRR
jgi:hypothetical protein